MSSYNFRIICMFDVLVEEKEKVHITSRMNIDDMSFLAFCHVPLETISAIINICQT